MSKFSTKKFDSAGGAGGKATKEYDTPKRYDMCYVDTDTILYKAATFAQDDYLEVKHNKSGRVKEFKNVTEFRGRSVKVEGGWLKETNEAVREKGGKEYTLEDFTVTPKARLNPEHNTVEEAVKNAMDSIGFSVGAIKKFMDSKDYRLVIGAGKGNYRDKEAKSIGYKSSRGEKPIFFAEIREAFVEQYKSRIIETVYAEAEDTLGWYAALEEARVGTNFDDWKVCISFIDKDVKCVYAPSFNYSKFEDGWTYPTKLECAGHLISQSISGDPTDTINGIPTLTQEVTERFGLRKANGCGKATAEKLLATCTSEREMWERAIFAYQSYYGLEDEHKFKDCHGEEQSWGWLDFLQETYILVKMQDYEGQVSKIYKHFDYLGIDYSKLLCQDIPDEMKGGKELEQVVGDCEVVVEKIANELSSYKSLTKGLLVSKLDEVSKLVATLKGNMSLIKE